MNQEGDPTGELPQIFSAVSDRCANCHAKLATDQAYCLNCGERRGKPRFAFSSLASPAAVPAGPPLPPRPVRRARVSSGATLVTGIGTLILAMGVGVLIGEQGKTQKTTPVAATPQIITVAGGGSGAATTATTASNTGTTSTHHKGKAKVTKVVITKQVAAKATQAAQNVLGGNANIAPPTTKVGGSCSNNQAGCQGGQFTGNFFGQ